FGNRRTERNASMFLSGGHVYVYRSYGIHWGMNIVCCDEGVAGAVLLRALEPLAGLGGMRERRGADGGGLVCSAPGRGWAARRLTREHDGVRVDAPPFELRPRTRAVEVVRGTRIGITKAAEREWRYGLAGSRYVSRPFRAPAA